MAFADEDSPRTSRHRRAAIALGGVVATAAVAYAVAWMVIADGFRDSIAAWTEARRADGYSIAYDRIDVGGFPTRIEATIGLPSFGTGGDVPAWTWRGGHAVVRMWPWTPDQVRVDLAGDHDLTIRQGGRAVSYRGSADRLLAILDIAGGRVRAVKVVGGEIALRGDVGDMSMATIRLDVWHRPDIDEAGKPPSIRLHLTTEDIRLPAIAALPLGNHIGRVEAKLDLMGEPSRAPLSTAFAAWRDAGGTIEVRHLVTEYGPLALIADGTVALDRNLQPIGAFTAEIEGFFETIDALRDRGQMRPGDSALAKLVLGILAERPPNGGAAVLKVPVTIQDRVLSAGPVDLVTLPILVWPGTKEE
jgi:hypothetical protein